MQEELVDCAVAVTRSRCSGHQGVCNESIDAVAIVNASLYDGHSHSGHLSSISHGGTDECHVRGRGPATHFVL